IQQSSFSATPDRPIGGNATLRATLLRVHADGYRLMVKIDQYRVGSPGFAHVAPQHETWHGLCWLVGQESQPSVRSSARTNDVLQEEADDAIPQSA
ncbi:MAG: hypothetical protein LM522_05385, partial [Candidatus Contendobacter sp.]|nr:hypothetical protein [Candidatus Contendobacter sp.]